jgi:hypothetical protein
MLIGVHRHSFTLVTRTTQDCVWDADRSSAVDPLDRDEGRGVQSRATPMPTIVELGTDEGEDE